MWAPFYFFALVGILATTTSAQVHCGTLKSASRTDQMYKNKYCADIVDDEPWYLLKNTNRECGICMTFEGKGCTGRQTWWGGPNLAVDLPIDSRSYFCL